MVGVVVDHSDHFLLEIGHNQIETMAKKTKKQIRREAKKRNDIALRADERLEALSRYRMCLNHQTLEMLSTVSTMSATEIVKVFSDVEYRISSVDGNRHSVTLFALKIWDLIVLKLTEVVDHKQGRFQWYEKDDVEKTKEWCIVLSIQTIAECLNILTDADSLTHLYDRIIDAANVLQNISITMTDRFRKECTIDGYLDLVGIQEHCDIDDCIMKSNAIFFFFINPQLIDHLDSQRVGLYHFNHAWLHFTGNRQNAYAAAKRFGRFYSQNTHNRKVPEYAGVSMAIGTLKKHLPSLNNKVEKDNRVALDNALKSIPDVFYTYSVGDQKYTFEELKKLGLRSKYDRVKIIVRFLSHPKTSSNEVTTEKIMEMNDDAMYFTEDGRRLFSAELADTMINHKGILKRPVKRLEVSSDEPGAVLQESEDTAATENIATDDNDDPVGQKK
jgi:hypothetical protein